MGSAEIVFRFLMPRADKRNGMKGRGEEGGEAANPIPPRESRFTLYLGDIHLCLHICISSEK